MRERVCVLQKIQKRKEEIINQYYLKRRGSHFYYAKEVLMENRNRMAEQVILLYASY